MIAWSQQPPGDCGHAAQLASLRREFPDWGFVVTGRWWVAVRGRQPEVRASSAQELRRYLCTLPH